MSDAITLLAGSTYRAESLTDTPIFSAVVAADPLFSPFVVFPDTGRRAPTHRDSASFSLSCLVPRSTVSGRHRRRRSPSTRLTPADTTSSSPGYA